MGTVVVLGSTITDLVARAPRLPVPGEAVIGDDFSTFLGGKGFNQAVAAARLDARVFLIGRVGIDTFGDAFSTTLSNEGIDNTHLTRDPNHGTGTACVMIGAESGQNAIIVVPRANLALTAEIVEEALQSLLAQSTFQVYRSIFMAQCEMRMHTIAAGLRYAHKEGLTTIFNAAPVPRETFPDDLLPCVDILVVNESEAGGLAGTTVDSCKAHYHYTGCSGLCLEYERVRRGANLPSMDTFNFGHTGGCDGSGRCILWRFSSETCGRCNGV